MSAGVIEGACTPVTVQIDQELNDLENGLTDAQRAYFRNRVRPAVSHALAEISKIEASPTSPKENSLALQHCITELRLAASALRVQSLQDKPKASDLLRGAFEVENLKLQAGSLSFPGFSLPAAPSIREKEVWFKSLDGTLCTPNEMLQATGVGNSDPTGILEWYLHKEGTINISCHRDHITERIIADSKSGLEISSKNFGQDVFSKALDAARGVQRKANLKK